MTEAEWEACDNAIDMIVLLTRQKTQWCQPGLSDCFWCRRLSSLPREPGRESATTPCRNLPDDRDHADECNYVAITTLRAIRRVCGSQPEEWHTMIPGLLRCIFGNPFRPVAFDPTWRTPDVIAIATAAYDERILPSGELDVGRLAVLADALEEMGNAPEVVAHLRSDGPHVRGCWAVDLCLGKA